jgi:hypothetical protein
VQFLTQDGGFGRKNKTKLDRATFHFDHGQFYRIVNYDGFAYFSRKVQHHFFLCGRNYTDLRKNRLQENFTLAALVQTP